MQAEKLKKKKGTINKGKVKKTLKNVICRPDLVFWPAVTEDEEKVIDSAFKIHRVCIPEFKKLHWNKLKSIPKSNRPKPQPIEKVDGLLFGISSCSTALKNGDCSVILVEGTVDPKDIVKTIIDDCILGHIPVICVNNLRIMTKNYFGISTSCLGIQKEKLSELSKTIIVISQNYKPKIHNNLFNTHPDNSKISDMGNISSNDFTEETESKNEKDKLNSNYNKMPDPNDSMDIDINPYLFRKDKKSRIFVPSSQCHSEKQKFSGQQFIQVSDNIGSKTDRKAYMNMILKKMSNNPNRIKLKLNKEV